MQNSRIISLIAILATVSIVHAQTTGVNIVTPPLDKYVYQLNAGTGPAITFSDGVYVQDTFSNSPIACNGDWQKANVQIYKKGTCFNIPAATTSNPVTAQANVICNFAYTVTNLQTSYSTPNPQFQADSSFTAPTGPTYGNSNSYVYINNPSAGCSYQLILDVANCAQTLYMPYYGQGCQNTVGNIQYQTVATGGILTVGGVSTTTRPDLWLGGATTIPTSTTSYSSYVNTLMAAFQSSATVQSQSLQSAINCAVSNPANINKLNAAPVATTTSGTTTVSSGTAAKFQCGAPDALTPSPTGSAQTCQNGMAGCTCVNGISSRCLYSLESMTSGTPYNLLVMSSWNNNLGQGCTGNMTEAQVVVTGTCLTASHLTTTKTIKINGDVLNKPYVKATVGAGGQQYNLNFYHTEVNCLADSNAVETYVGEMGTCLTEDDHPSDDVNIQKTLPSGVKYTNVFYGPNNVVGQTNRILVNYYPASYSCNGNDDDNYCTITSGGVAGIVIAVVFVVFLLLVILFMCIRYCGKAPAAGAAPTVTTQKGGEGNPLLSGSV